MSTIEVSALLIDAAGLLSDDASNTEYDRAIVELVSTLLGFQEEERDVLAKVLRNLSD